MPFSTYFGALNPLAAMGITALGGASACSELAAMFPRCGGDYIYQREAFGPSVAFASGAGAAARNSVGTAVAGGMLASTVLSVVFIPVLYVIIRTLVPGTVRSREAEA